MKSTLDLLERYVREIATSSKEKRRSFPTLKSKGNFDAVFSNRFCRPPNFTRLFLNWMKDLKRAQIENEMVNLEGTSLISTTREKTAALVLKISVEADAGAKKTAADANNQRQVDAALTEAKAHKISVQAKAEAEASAILVKAKAEAEAIRPSVPRCCHVLRWDNRKHSLLSIPRW
jgi:uncharacterized membrane protein YqiK